MQNGTSLNAVQKLSMETLRRKTMDEYRDAEKMPVIVVLENIRSAYNVGSVFRTADAFLIDAVYLAGYTATPPHKEIKKTALGAEASVQWKHFTTSEEAVHSLRESGYQIFVVEQTTSSVYLQHFEINPAQKIAVIFGNEVSGVENSTITLCDGCLEIPQLGMKHSINVATAAGIVLWEMVRGRIPVGADLSMTIS